jgi:hypothetical protein
VGTARRAFAHPSLAARLWRDFILKRNRYNQTTSPNPIREAKMRAETSAAVASAVAAVASAAAAICALIFLSHQEEIARSQLQATYFSNLYSKQVDSTGALEASILEFYEQTKILHDAFPPDYAYVRDFQSELRKNSDNYHKAQRIVVLRAKQTALVMPKSFGALSDHLSSMMYDLLGFADKFATSEPEKDKLESFATAMNEAFGRLSSWYDQVPECLHRSFVRGSYVTEESLLACNLDYKWGVRP